MWARATALFRGGFFSAPLQRGTFFSRRVVESKVERRLAESAGASAFGRRFGGCLLASPLMFTEWKTEKPKSELIFLSGDAIGSLTEKIFENEAGQSLFMVVLFIAYLALMGSEGRVNGAVWRIKHAVATNWGLPVHRNYMHVLPPNPLLQRAQPQPTRSAPSAASAKASSA